MVAAYGENYVWLNDSVTLDGYEGSENETAPERRRELTAIDTIEIYRKTSDATEFFDRLDVAMPCWTLKFHSFRATPPMYSVIYYETMNHVLFTKHPSPAVRHAYSPFHLSNTGWRSDRTKEFKYYHNRRVYVVTYGKQLR